MTEPLPHPSLLDCTDWRALVQRRLQGLDLPPERLAERIGQPPGWTGRVLTGHRPLDPRLVEPLAHALRLDPATHRHLAALADLDSPSPRTRRRAFAAVVETQRRRASVELQEEEFLLRTRWTVWAVAELAACEGFRLDPAWVGAVLLPAIDEDQAQEALNVLLRMGILRMDETGTIVPDRGALAAAAGPGDPDAALARHAPLLVHAHDTMRAEDPDHHVAGIDLALSDAHHARVLERLRAFEQELVALAEVDPGPRTRVHRLQMQAFPLSLPTDAAPPPPPGPHGELEAEEPTVTDLNPDTVI